MNKATWAMLNDAEQALLREADKEALATLDEDELVELHGRVRRARTKYTKLYRRSAAAQVVEDASRARAHAAHARTLAKAEAFEEALARVSRALSSAARASADALRTERLAAASAVKGTPRRRGSTRPAGAPKATRAHPAPVRRTTRTPIRKKASASARAATRRAQARTDARGR